MSKPTKLSASVIAKVLKEAQKKGVSVADVCEKHGISQATYFVWKKRFGGMRVEDLKLVLALEPQNDRLRAKLEKQEKELDAVRSLVREFKDLPIRKKWAKELQKIGMSERRACELVGLGRSTARHKSRKK